MWNITIHISSLLIFIHLLLSKDCNLSLYPRQENQMKIRNPLPTIPALSKAFGSFGKNVTDFLLVLFPAGIHQFFMNRILSF